MKYAVITEEGVIDILSEAQNIGKQVGVPVPDEFNVGGIWDGETYTPPALTHFTAQDNGEALFARRDIAAREKAALQLKQGNINGALQTIMEIL